MIKTMKGEKIRVIQYKKNKVNLFYRIVKWSNIAMGPSKTPPKKFCVICGFIGKYKCYKCYKCKPNSIVRYVCSQKCDLLHKEVDCCKPKNPFIW